MVLLFAGFGFLLCTLVMLMVTAVWGLFAFQAVGKWNIGGVPNTWKDRAIAVLMFAAVAFGWYTLFSISPFKITITAL